jgi:anthranilate 1,2-dioxygenase small subunit
MIMDDLAVRFGIHELIADYAGLIDEDRLEEWPDLFSDPCRYLIISRADHAAGMRQGVMYAPSRGMLLDRVFPFGARISSNRIAIATLLAPFA